MNTEIFDLGKIGITLGGEYDNNVIYEKLTIGLSYYIVLIIIYIPINYIII